MKSKNNIRRAITFEIIYTLTLMAIFFFSGPELSTAGDLRIADDLASTSVPGFFFLAPPLAWVLRVLALIAPGVSWWVVFSIVAMFGSFFILIDTVRVVVDNRIAPYISLLMGLVFYMGFLVEPINFTQTTALVAVAGFALLLRSGAQAFDKSGDKKKSGKPGIWMIVLGVVLVLIAGAIRWKALVMCLPFALMVVAWRIIIEFITRAKTDKQKSVFVQQLLLMLLMVVLVGGSFTIHKVYGKINPYYAEYVAANELREDIFDYKHRYPSWEEYSEEYKALGIERSWYEMIFRSYTVDRNHFSADNLRVMRALRGKSQDTFANSFAVLKGHNVMWIAIWIIAVLVIGIACADAFGVNVGQQRASDDSNKKNIAGVLIALISAMGNILAILACVYAFAILGRSGWRVMVGIILMSVVSFLFMAFVGREKCKTESCSDRKEAIFSVISFALVLVFILKDITFVLPKAEVTDQQKSDLRDYMDSNDDIAYLLCDDVYHYECNSIWSGKDPSACDNVFVGVGGFGLGRMKDMERLGINDIVTDMLNKPNIYTFYNDTWHAYIWDYYGRNVSTGIVDSFDETDFIRYVAPKAAGDDHLGSVTPDLIMTLVHNDSYNGYAMWNISGTLEGDSQLLEGISEFYINVINDATGEIYSYPLVYQDGYLNGEEFYYDNTWAFYDTRRVIVGAIDGEYYNLADVSAAPVFEGD